MREYMDFVASIQEEITVFKSRQREAVAREEAR